MHTVYFYLEYCFYSTHSYDRSLDTTGHIYHSSLLSVAGPSPGSRKLSGGGNWRVPDAREGQITREGFPPLERGWWGGGRLGGLPLEKF